MNLISSLRSLALVVVLALAVSGCTSDTETPTAPSSSEPSNTSTLSAEPSVTPEPEPVSEPALQVSRDRSYRVVQEISGIVSWDVQPGPGVTAATSKKISQSADAFLEEHLLRSDRLQGKYAVKRGEMDDAKKQFTASTFEITSADIDWYDSNQQKFSADAAEWPKKQRDQTADRIRGIGNLFVVATLVSDGKGPIRNEVKRKVIYVTNGKIVAYTEVTGRRLNNTGSSKSVVIKQTMKKVDGRWLVDGVYWEVEQ